MSFRKTKVHAGKTMVRLDPRVLLPVLIMVCSSQMSWSADAPANPDPSSGSAQLSRQVAQNLSSTLGSATTGLYLDEAAISVSPNSSDEAATTDASSGSAQPSTGAAQNPSNQLSEVIVTAQQRAENVKDIPISISTLSGEDLSSLHILGYEDLTRTVPSVSFSAGGGGVGVGEGEDFIEIRGISSAAGSATTGLYLDDTSISVGQDSGVGAVQPMAVDIARVEVLRGPQGTLYGASSEGGTIRFIENQANLNTVEGKVSTEVSATYPAGGSYLGASPNLGANYLTEGVLNIPIIQGQLAIRLNAAYGYDSGWISNYSLTGNLQKADVNAIRRELLRLNAVYKPTDNLTITANLFYQRSYQSDAPVSDLRDFSYAAQDSFVIPPPIPSDGLFREHSEVQQWIDDQLFVPSLTVLYTTPVGDFTSITSYPYRDFGRVSDGTDYDSFFIGNYLNTITPNPQNLSVSGNLPSPAILPSSFRTVSQEFRFASHIFPFFGMNAHAVAGLYFSNQEERDSIAEPVVGINAAFQSIYGYGINSPQSPIGAPSDPNFWAADETVGTTSLLITRQYSVFGQFDLDVLPTLHASAGLRYVYADISSTALDLPYFFSSTVVGENPYINTQQTNTAWTPKFSLTYDVTPQANIYTTVAKGYRLGGAQVPNPAPVPPGNDVCNADYKFLGITAPSPSFGPDSVWSYELGSKMRLLDNTLSLDGAAYYIDWKDIQQSFILPFCGFSYAANVGNAKSYGGELEFAYKPKFAPGLTLALNGNISHATITETTVPTVVAVGQNVLFVPEFTFTPSADYRWSFNDRLSAYARVDYDMTGRSHGSYMTINPGYINEPYNVLNGAFGFLTEGFDIELYAKNIANNHTYIQTPAINLLVVGYTVRPLTAGINVTKTF